MSYLLSYLLSYLAGRAGCPRRARFHRHRHRHRQRHHDQRRHGSTLVEQLWVLLISGVLLAGTVAGGARLFDAMIVRASARDVADLFAVARDHAVEQGIRTAVRIDARAGRVIVYADRDTLSRLELRRSSAVRVEASRDSMAYSASGLGFGAANMRVIVARGASADTITVSRLGRVRR